MKKAGLRRLSCDAVLRITLQRIAELRWLLLPERMQRQERKRQPRLPEQARQRERRFQRPSHHKRTGTEPTELRSKQSVSFSIFQSI